jgi:diacylglycerol kinase family enzyme
MKATVILNAAAGTVERTTNGEKENLPQLFAKAGIVADIRIVPPNAVIPTLREALSSQPATVIVGGGDGTIRSAAEILAGTEVRLGVLPLGTLNHFAKDLNLPGDWRDAITALGTARAAQVDVGEVNGRVFLNNCSIGAYAETVRRRDALRRRNGGGKWRAMLRAMLETFRRFPRFSLRIDRDGNTHRLRTPLLLVGNNRYSGHVLDASMRPRLDEGRLWIYTAHVHRHFEAIRLALQTLVRGLEAADSLDAQEATDFTIVGESGKLPVALDGEPIELSGPLHFRIRPRALHVLAVPPK